MTTTSPRGEPVLRPALSVRARTLFLVLVALLAALPAAGLAVATGGGAGGHRSEVTVTGTGGVPVPGRPADRALPGPGGDGGTTLSCRAAEPPHGGPSR